MKKRKKKDKMSETAEIMLLAERMKELVCKTNQFIDEAMDVIHSDKMEDYQKIIAESDELIQECDYFCKL